MKSRFFNIFFVFTFLLTVNITHTLTGQENPDYVAGNLIQFNDNGFWCWYQDERAVIDISQNKLITGSDASGQGTGGSNRNGLIEGVIYDLETGESERYTFMNTSCDDHNTPAFLIRPDGKYLTMYAEHYDRYNSRFRIFDDNSWTDEQRFDWTTIPGGTDFTIAYSNLFYLSAENRIYNFARANRRSPNMIISDDMGETWSYGGILTLPDVSIGYVNGYFIYYGNGKDRIDFICTEHHPRDYNTSMYHGYIKGGKSYRSDGVMLDDDITDLVAPKPADFTPVFLANTEFNGYLMSRIWNVDLQRYDNGVIAAILKARIDDVPVSNNPDHCFLYCRYNGESWKTSYLCLAGKKMYSSEQDYTGLAAIDPSDPYTIYISTPIDPRNDNELDHREIFKGISGDLGETWSWIPVTFNSSTDNFRPVIPVWDENNRAVLWCRGEYYAAQSYNAAIVGLLEIEDKETGKMLYQDATLQNTTLSNGDPLTYTGPDTNKGADDDLWHLRTGYGNNDTLFTSAERGGEDAPEIRTEVTVPKEGEYYAWVNFWADPESDWRIKAGLSENEMHIFRQKTSKKVSDTSHTEIILTSDDNLYLYQAYLGKVAVNGSTSFFVYIDDESIKTGTTDNRTGNTARTWYDGISFTSADFISISKSRIVLGNGSSATDSFKVMSNTDWFLNNPEIWLTIDTLVTKGDQTVQVTAKENTTDTIRVSEIVISSQSVPEKKINIIQIPSAPNLSVSKTEIGILPKESNDSSFIITSNTAWHITSSKSWLSTNIEYGMNNDTVTLHVTANPELEERIATLTIESHGLPAMEVVVTQKAYQILKAYPERLTFGADENLSDELIIYSNVDWTLSGSPDWLSASLNSGENNDTIVFTAIENMTNTARSAQVTLSSPGLNDFTIDIVQDKRGINALLGKKPEFIKIYPDSAEDFVMVENPGETKKQIELLTIDGKSLQAISTFNNVTRIDLSNYSAGIYVIRVKSGEQLFVRKIVKK